MLAASPAAMTAVMMMPAWISYPLAAAKMVRATVPTLRMYAVMVRARRAIVAMRAVLMFRILFSCCRGCCFLLISLYGVFFFRKLFWVGFLVLVF